jgi:arginase
MAKTGLKPVRLIGAGSGWGAGVREAEDGPRGLRAFGLAERLAALGVRASWAEMVEPENRWHDHRDLSRAEVFDLVARHNGALADAVTKAMAARALPVVIGGDHAIAMGTWGGVARGMRRAPFGLIWMDAHLDAHTVATTPSMNAHGMSAAVLLGHGTPEFLAVGGGALQPEHFCYVGVRSYEVAEWALLRRLGVRIFFMDEVRERGLAAVMADAIAIVTRGTRGFGLTIDLDGFDPADVPGVGLPVADGLRGAETAAVLRGIARDPRLRALEIVEYAPALDRDHRTAQLVLDLLVSALTPAAHAQSISTAA